MDSAKMADCPHIPEIKYGEFSKGFHEKVLAKHVLLAGSLELTYRCNLDCVHCYIDHSDLGDELSPREISSLLDECMAEGMLWLLFTGGEPFLRKDFLDIYKNAKKKGFIITIFTNGTLITPEVVDFLRKWRPFSIEITLYGASREVYEAVTKVPGSYDKCMRAIDLLLAGGLPLKLKSVIMKPNAGELDALKAFAAERDVNFRFDAMLNPMINGSKNPAKVALAPEEVLRLDLEDPARMKAWQKFVQKFGGPPPNQEYLYTCGAGWHTLHIDPYGQISTCILARTPSYDLRNGTLSEGWHEFIPRVRAEKRRYDYPCATCEKIALCGQCPAWGQLEHADPEKPVEYLCKLAHLRAEALKGATLAERT